MSAPLVSLRWLIPLCTPWLPLLAEWTGALLSPVSPSSDLLSSLLAGLGGSLLAALLAWVPWVLPGAALTAGGFLAAALLVFLPPGG